MKTYKNYLLAVTGIVILLGSFVLSVPRPTLGHDNDPVGPTKPVKVVNTPAEPVPVTGSVSIGNSQANPLFVRDVEFSPRLPIQESGSCSTSSTLCETPVFGVPQGKRLVIEYASLRASVVEGVVVQMAIETMVGTTAKRHNLAPSSAAVSTVGVTLGQQVRLYADAGTIVTLIGFKSDPSTGGQFNFTFTGYLEDMP